MSGVAVCLLILVTVVCSAQFHQWGGKRETGWQEQKKNGFNSWGGKRAGFNSWGGKRAGFNSWGGKRAGFNSWGGKRNVWGSRGDNDESVHDEEEGDTNASIVDLFSVLPDILYSDAGTRQEAAADAPVNFLISKLCNRLSSSDDTSSDYHRTKRSHEPFCSTFLGIPMSSPTTGKQESFNPWGGKRSKLTVEKPSTKKHAQSPQFYAWGGKRAAQMHPQFSTLLPPLILENQMT